MIRSIKIELNAAFPNMPLLPFNVFHGSAAAITVLNVPRRIEAVAVRVVNVDGESGVFSAQRSGSAWTATIPGEFLSQPGTSGRGIKIEGVDELGNVFTLGVGDLIVLQDDGTIIPVVPPTTDETVTRDSPRPVKSSGIWSFVKNLGVDFITSIKDALGDKRDKDDLAVYEKVGVGDDWVWTSDDPDLLNALETNDIKPKRVDDDSVGYHFWYTSSDFGDWSHAGEWDPGYGVDAHIVQFKYDNPVLEKFNVTATATRSYKLSPVSPADRLATTNGVNAAIAENNVGYRVRESVALSGAAELAMNANGVRSADETRSGAMLFDQIDGKATKTELAGYLSLTGGYLKGPVYFDAGGRIYTDQGGISVNTHQGLNVYGGGSIVLESNESLTDFDNNPIISATNPDFSNAVLAVGLNIDTNSVAVLNDIAATFGGFPLGAGETATTVGGLLAALAAAAAWLKNNKVGSFASVGGASATVDNGVAKLDDFFTESNSLLNGRLAYSRNATGLKDRAFNALTFDGTEYNLSTALAAVTPTESGQPRDLLIVATATAATTISFTAGTIKGDKPTIDGSGTWLITLTEYASGVWYCRQIKMEDAA